MTNICKGCNASQTKKKNDKLVCAYCGNEIIVVETQEIVANAIVKGNGNILIQNSNSIINIGDIHTFNA
jgi:uncharacterized Zn ribbon protein